MSLRSTCHGREHSVSCHVLTRPQDPFFLGKRKLGSLRSYPTPTTLPLPHLPTQPPGPSPTSTSPDRPTTETDGVPLVDTSVSTTVDVRRVGGCDWDTVFSVPDAGVLSSVEELQGKEERTVAEGAEQVDDLTHGGWWYGWTLGGYGKGIPTRLCRRGRPNTDNPGTRDSLWTSRRLIRTYRGPRPFYDLSVGEDPEN